MKIVRQGSKPPKYPWVGTYLCTACKTVIELDADDGDNGRVLDAVDDHPNGYFVKTYCPVCAADRTLLEWEQTQDYKNWLRDKDLDARGRS